MGIWELFPNFTSLLQHKRNNWQDKTKSKTMVIEFEKDVLKAARKVVKMRGNIKRCAESTGIDRTTVARAIKAGTGEETTVNPITEYIKKLVA